MVTEQDIRAFHDELMRIKAEIGKDMVGQEDIVDGVLIAMVAGGNVLLEGVPGLGKTRLVRTLGRVFDLPFSRIQFTPDLMPADVIGTNIVVRDQSGGARFSFQPGPIFSSIVLADEINRATPKTQSALLEAMQEHTVTAGGQSRRLPEPFFVLATQNPIEQEGTYPLPEAQMDRFFFKLLVPFPTPDELVDIVLMTQKKEDQTSQRCATGEDLLRMREVARGIPVADRVMRAAVSLVAATHPESELGGEAARKYLRYGASPRAAQALIFGAKVRALMKGRMNAALEDIHALACAVLRHRVALNFEAVTTGVTPDAVIGALLEEQAGKGDG